MPLDQPSEPDHLPVTIVEVGAREILDSRGYPTVAVTLRLADGHCVGASAPAGASTGEHEARELRDHETAFSGRGVHRSLAMLRDVIAPVLVDRPWSNIDALDRVLRELDGSPDFARIGSNSSVVASIAAARALAHGAHTNLARWISAQLGTTPRLPVPHFNVVNGGAHASNDLAFQEFMIAPVGASTMLEAVEAGAEVYHALGSALRSDYGAVGVGDEGGYSPPVDDERRVIEHLLNAIDTAGFGADGSYFSLALDPAANFFRDGGRYRLRGRWLDSDELVERYADLVATYPIRSIEDGIAEDDVTGWRTMCDELADRIQIVGDDLYVTDPARIREGAAQRYSNAVLIKPNQIGTVSQTFEAIRAANEGGMHAMVSHRSGETLDTFIADLAVGAGTGQIKAGAPARGERVAKYNRLIHLAAQTDLPYGLRADA